MSESEIEWEPKPSDRTYFRSTLDAQRAYLVRTVSGEDMLRLDRPGQEILRKLDDTWKPDDQTYPITPHQAAKIAFIADCALCAVIGEPQLAKREWLSVKEQERIRFMREGPKVGGIRDKLFRHVMTCLKELTGG